MICRVSNISPRRLQHLYDLRLPICRVLPDAALSPTSSIIPANITVGIRDVHGRELTMESRTQLVPISPFEVHLHYGLLSCPSFNQRMSSSCIPVKCPTISAYCLIVKYLILGGASPVPRIQIRLPFNCYTSDSDGTFPSLGPNNRLKTDRVPSLLPSRNTSGNQLRSAHA